MAPTRRPCATPYRPIMTNLAYLFSPELLTTLLVGFTLSLATIMALGPQNVHVIRMGLPKNLNWIVAQSQSSHTNNRMSKSKFRHRKGPKEVGERKSRREKDQLTRPKTPRNTALQLR